MKIENLTRLRDLASTSRTEWRVADPVTKVYCATFDRSDTLTPEEDANAWLDDQRKRFPGGRFGEYEVVKVEVQTELQRLVIDLLADFERLNKHSDPVLLAQFHAQCKHLLDDLTVTTLDEHGLAEHSPVASLTYSNFIGALVPLVSRAGAALANPQATQDTTEPGPSFERMFNAAVLDLAAISEALDTDPDEGGAEPILEAIAALKAQAATKPSTWSVWEALPGYLIDNCEGTTVSEEMLQRALEAMLKDPKYAGPHEPTADQPVPRIAFTKEWCMAAAHAEEKAQADFSVGVTDQIKGGTHGR